MMGLLINNAVYDRHCSIYEDRLTIVFGTWMFQVIIVSMRFSLINVVYGRRYSIDADRSTIGFGIWMFPVINSTSDRNYCGMIDTIY